MNKISGKFFTDILLIAAFVAVYIFLPAGIYGGSGDDGEQAPPSNEEKIKSYSQAGNFELGGIMGMPSGLNSRYWFTDSFGLDFSLGSTVNRDFIFTLDVLYEPFELYRSNDHYMRFFIGAGTMSGYFNDEFYYSLRVPAGLSMPFTTYPVTFSFYVAPAYILQPGPDIDINWGIAARYSFTTAAAIVSRENRLLKDHGELKERHENISTRLDSTMNDLDRTRKDLDRTRDDMDRTISELKKTRGELDTTKGQLSTTKGDLGKTIDRLTVARNELEDTRSKLTSTKESLDHASDELTVAKDQLDSAKTQITTMRRELDSVKNQLDLTREELNRARKRIDDREAELKDKQAELALARSLIKEALTGDRRIEEEKKLARLQEELNSEAEALKKEKEVWQKESENQKQKRESLRSECESRRGIINEQGYCDCRKNEQWNSERSACVCVKGYRLNSSSNLCEPCDTVSFSGACVAGCASDEKKVTLAKGPHKYVCVKRCSKSNEVWSDRKNSCVCGDGYSRDARGECVPRR
jgi:uncharacterized coiled-coil DUF342 family protein